MHLTMILTFSSHIYVRTLDNQGCVQLASMNVVVHLSLCQDFVIDEVKHSLSLL